MNLLNGSHLFDTIFNFWTKPYLRNIYKNTNKYHDMGKYLGIDESNHGQIPEIFVATFSRERKDIVKKHNIPKLRYRTIENKFNKQDYGPKKEKSDRLTKFMQEKYKDLVIDYMQTNFKHILFDKTFYYTLKEFQRIIAITEFIKHYEPKTIIIDGNLYENEKEEISRLIHPIRNPEIIAEPRADTTYQLVNKADAIANHLYSKYKLQKPENRILHLEHLLTPKLEDYWNLYESKINK